LSAIVNCGDAMQSKAETTIKAKASLFIGGTSELELVIWATDLLVQLYTFPTCTVKY
jgi:hypothetical protein